MKIGIAGLGLIGGSLALALRENGFDVVAWNHRSAPYEAARTNGIECVRRIEELAAAEPDVLVLCTPLKAMDSVLQRLAPVLSHKTTLTDVGSVKREVLDSVSRHGLRSVFVGAHPMAGNELAGFDAADARLFDGATWALTVEKDTDRERFIRVGQMVCDGVKNRFIVTTSVEHDKATAQISHIPHVVATALAAQLVDNPVSNVALALAAGSWRDMTRVALTTPDRTQAMVDENPDNVAVLLHGMAQRLEEAAELIEKGAPLESFFMRAQPYREVKAKLNKKIPEGVFTVRCGESDDSWASDLVAASRRGGRVEHIDVVEATVRHFPHLREEE
ncbi:prephenate dehydrogenase [Alloscardovia omnicolens]|uniref:prephenate dehydrogenase n=1 Tax=Alloscardovia omnicolens TaxID=419015 RepID=UPI0007643B37|nr:prephenate dehydrogenase/arogenate dehydrogenase family protein [Alloscardovia omnicolens]KWZ73642.1 prephenate dehydrogenase [Alloscardovia omnicolens]